MKIEGEIADPRAVAAWKASLASAPSKRILDFVALTPSLQAGFRPGKMTHKVAVTRVQAMLEQTGEMPVTLRELLSGIGLDRSLLAVLSEEAIGEAEGHMRDFFGADELYSAMLLSDREGVRSMGVAGFGQGDFPQPAAEEKEAARAALKELFRPFLEVLGSSTEPDVAAPPVSVEKERESAGDTDKRYALIKSELAEKSREAIRLGKDLAQTKADLEKALAQTKGLEGSLQAVRASLAAEKTAREHLTQTFEQAVADETKRRVDARVLPWLEPAEGLAAAVAQSGSNNALEQAEAVLSRQKHTDRRYGLWSQLARERDDCLAMIERLNIAKQESIQPLAELGAAADSLAARVAELDRMLGLGAVIPTPRLAPDQLALRITDAATLDELAALRADLEASNRLGFLHEGRLSAAYRLIDDACWKLYSTLPDNQAAENDGDLLQMLPLHVLERALGRGEPCLLLIDGHNALFRLRSALQLEFEGDTPGSRARKQLADRLGALSTRFPNLDTHLWYDGESAHDVSVSRNLVVHYSGGIGSNRADAQIVKYFHSTLYMKSTQKSQLKALVSADRDLAKEARMQGAVILAPEELAILVSPPEPNRWAGRK